MKRGLGNGRLWKRDGAWTLDYRDEHGKRRREVLSTTKREAQELQADIIAKRNRVLRGLEDGVTDIALRELIDAYLADLAARATAKHVTNVRINLDRVLSAIQGKTVAQLQPIEVVNFRSQVVAAGRSNRWANVQVEGFRAMLKWGKRMRLASMNPLEDLPKLPEGGRHQVCRRRALTDSELAALLDAVRIEDEEQAQRVRRVPQAPFWRLLIECGSRYGETRLLRWMDIDEAQALVTFEAEDTKSGHGRVVPLNQGLLSDLVALKAHHWAVTGLRPMLGDPVFLSPRGKPLTPPTNNANRSLRRLLEKAGIERVDPRGRKVDLHALRGSFASRMDRLGVPLSQTQALLGHSTPALTAKHYVRHQVDDLRRAIEAMTNPSPMQRAVGDTQP